MAQSQQATDQERDIPAYEQHRIRSDRRMAIFDRLMIVSFGHRSVSFVNGWEYVPVRRRRTLLKEIDDLQSRRLLRSIEKVASNSPAHLRGDGKTNNDPFSIRRVVVSSCAPPSGTTRLREIP